VAPQDEMSESRLDAAHGETIHSLHKTLDSLRESLQEKECECRVYSDRPSDRGFRQKEARVGSAAIASLDNGRR
jgi:hypothetical protein